MNNLKKIQVLSLRRRGAIYVPAVIEKNKENKKVLFGAFLKILEQYGFYLDVNDNKVISAFREEKITVDILTSVIEALKYAYSLHDDVEILYPDFPLRVENSTDLELFVDSIIYALTSFEVLPQKKEEYSRITKNYISNKEYKSLTIIDDKDMVDIFWNLAESTIALSDTDKEDLLFLLNQYTNEIKLTSSEHNILFKETMAMLVVECNKLGIEIPAFMKTPTDLLRVLQYMEEKKTDLSKRFKIPKFSKEIKDFIAKTIDSLDYNVEDILRYSEEWKHIFRYVKKSKLRNEYNKYLYRKKQFSTFYSKEDKYFKLYIESKKSSIENKTNTVESVFSDYIKLLSQRPAELLRKVDKILRTNLSSKCLNILLDNITISVSKTEKRIAYQLYNFLSRRSISRGVFYSNSFHTLKEHKKIDEEIINKVKIAILKGLKISFEKFDNPIVVKYDKVLDNIPISTSNRYISENFNGLIPCCVLNLNDNYNYLRIFTSWDKNSTDIDLSVISLNKYFERIGTCTYYNLKSQNNSMIHSGDIRRGPGTEFVDIDIDKLKSLGVRYIFVQNYNYDGDCMRNIKTGLSIVDKENKQSGTIHKEKEVLLSSFISNDVRSIYSFVIDLDENKVLWLDTPKDTKMFSNFETNPGMAEKLLRYYDTDVITVGKMLKLGELTGKFIFDNPNLEKENNYEVVELINKNEDGTLVVKHDIISSILL